jgi:eukaryotic-like serine/threonine-protein kinase
MNDDKLILRRAGVAPSLAPVKPPPRAPEMKPDGPEDVAPPGNSARLPSAGYDPLFNVLLDGRYRLGQPIGRGGMGVVYRAFDTRLARPVAVKLLVEAGPTNKERFAREVQALGRLTHPNLVRLLDAEPGAQGYLVMDLIEGKNLAWRLAHGPISPEATARIGAGLASALAYVHSQGIVHRDVKPANVIVDREGKAYLTDFGIARLLGTAGVTATGLTMGTPAYLAPEQLRGDQIGPEADVYALGLVLIECLSGRPPFEGTEAEVMAARLYRDPAVPALAGAAWRDLLTAMTAAAPSLRPSATYVAGALSRDRLGHEPLAPRTDGNTTDVLPLVASQPAPEPAPARGRRKTARRRRHQFLAVLLAAGGAAALTLFLSGAYSGQPHRSAKLVRSTTVSTLSTTVPTSTRPPPTTTTPSTTTPAPNTAGPSGPGPGRTGPSGAGPAPAIPTTAPTTPVPVTGVTPVDAHAPQGAGPSGVAGAQGGGLGHHFGRALSRFLGHALSRLLAHDHSGTGVNGQGGYG